MNIESESRSTSQPFTVALSESLFPAFFYLSSLLSDLYFQKNLYAGCATVNLCSPWNQQLSHAVLHSCTVTQFFDPETLRNAGSNIGFRAQCARSRHIVGGTGG